MRIYDVDVADIVPGVVTTILAKSDADAERLAIEWAVKWAQGDDWAASGLVVEVRIRPRKMGASHWTVAVVVDG